MEKLLLFLAPLGFVVNVILYFCLKNNKKLNDVISRKEKFMSLDYTGILAATASLTLILIPLNGGGSTYAWDSNIVIIMFTVGGVLLIVFWELNGNLLNYP